MSDFLKFMEGVVLQHKIVIDIYYSKITDWCILIRTRTNSVDTKGTTIFEEQDPDLQLVCAKAHVFIKEWLLENEGGY